MNEKPTKHLRRQSSHMQSLQKYLALLQRGGDVRGRKIRQLRAALREQRYENELKFSVAVERLLGEL
jgi:hypothetical protein